MKNFLKKNKSDEIKDDFKIDSVENNISSTPKNEVGKEKNKTSIALVFLFSLGLVILLFTVLIGYFLFWTTSLGSNSVTRELTQVRVISEESAIIEAVEKNGPAVVNIYAYYSGNTGRVLPRLNSDKNLVGLGSGVIIETDGLILTNKHILKTGTNRVDYEVVLKDDRKFKVQRVYQDPVLDLAIIKIEADNLPKVEMGDSDQLKLGQSVIAIGNPMGLSNSVTKGVVSALNRDIDVNTSLFESERYQNMIQTDAAINPGNSGGGLFNLSGQLVGINSAAGLSSDNIGFAIPINKAKEVILDFKNNGSEMFEIGQAFIGISYNFERFDYYIKNGYPIGPVVKSILKDSPAEKSGVQVGDIVVSIDGVEFYSENDLADYISTKKIGEKVQLKIYRDEKIIYKEVELARRTD